MWHIEGPLHFRACVERIRRNSLRLAYFLKWDDKLGEAVPLKSSTRQYRTFQSFAIFFTVINQINKLDKKFFDLIPKTGVPEKSKKLIANLASSKNLANLLTFTMNYTSPAMETLVAFSDNAPLYEFALHILHVTRIHLIARIVIATITTITFNILASVTYLCLLFVISGILFFHFWSNILLKKDVSFQKTIQIYNQLKVMTILVQELGHDLVSMCLHAYCVIISTMAMYHFILQFTKGNQMSVLVTLPTVLTFLLATGFEMLVICQIAKATIASKEILRKLLTNHGNDKYRRRLVRSLLPNSISLEFVDSVDTIRNGIGMVYFLRYLDRVQSYTTTWLLATKHNQ
ncbi:hypothetical protein Fcan01_16878 [Folsomia candida]|uniref:Gustatory receptor n=1 Tax=Folsomia candida TaxID=158441 RepID=A0A226DV58_FOLCA|nr:hypothetical protein Fcan01_16878 [Folsomia candida]